MQHTKQSIPFSAEIGSNLALGTLYPHKLLLSTKPKGGNFEHFAQSSDLFCPQAVNHPPAKRPFSSPTPPGSKGWVFRRNCGEKTVILPLFLVKPPTYLPLIPIFGRKNGFFKIVEKNCATSRNAPAKIGEKALTFPQTHPKKVEFSFLERKNILFYE